VKGISKGTKRWRLRRDRAPIRPGLPSALFLRTEPALTASELTVLAFEDLYEAKTLKREERSHAKEEGRGKEKVEERGKGER